MVVTNWQPLSQRHGGKDLYPEGPFEGVPPHLQPALLAWIDSATYSTQGQRYRIDLMQFLALRFRIPNFPHSGSGTNQQEFVLNAARVNDDLLLDMIDAILKTTSNVGVTALRNTLRFGGSVWTVADTLDALTRVVDPTASEAAVRAMTPGDDAAAELRAAWGHVYGRAVDPSDAWDHAIKAVEALLNPLVSPDNPKATLGSILATMRHKPSKWVHLLPADATDATGIEILISMLELMWPNPDRHATGASRKPTLGEAQAVVQLAVLVVSWLRDGAITAKSST